MKVQSNGMGQQSAALYLMSSTGFMPPLDYSIFADPGKEKGDTYKFIEWLEDWQKENNGIPLIIDKSKNLYDDILNQRNSTGHRFASIPAFSETGGMIRRQCTNEYKIEVVNNNIRKLQKKKKGQSFDKVEVWFGISLDEMRRMATPHRKNVTHVYPFCGYKIDFDGKVDQIDTPKMTRGQINEWMKKNEYPIPPKSSCVFCPFQSNRNWQELKDKHPEDFKGAIKVDESIRDMSQRGLVDKIFIHRSLKPLKDVDFTAGQSSIFDEDGEDCFGYCGI